MFLSDQTITNIILVTLIVDFTMNFVADRLNIGKLTTHLPEKFSDVYDPKRYERSQQYLRATTRLGTITSTLDLGILLAFWFIGGFGVLDNFVRETGWSSIGCGLLFIGILAGCKFIISLPFSIYSTFVIEENFGFNKITPKLFVLDLIKSMILSMVLGIPLLSAIFWFFESSGPWAWIICWGVTTTFILAVQYIVPTWIMPLFNKFTPLEDGELKNKLFAYAKSIDFPLTQIFVMDGSKRSSKSNAFFTGFGKNKRIVLFDTLINAHTPDELLAVLAHEMGHFKKKHIQRRLIFGILQMGVIFYLLSLFITQKSLFTAFYVDTPSIYAGLVFFSILFSPVDLVISIIMQFFSRKDEYAADRFAALTTKKAGDLITALKKLSADNLANLTPHPFYVFLNYSHPPLAQRIAAMEKIEGAA
ncbi:MAG: M48 family metallopeptidase [Desulfobacter postgatei]|jgi:STE24 endopeptidase|uniref:M48 family metallopeptidase n=1 Tax=Desulfobacter postgatei TaxID=2293 RepID=UPI0023F3675D|nr:M48 family metallopeptidase [Desulfobacter postgatei]MDD4274126.1 M48 family metallopeptidase [Desulfobacter postgatei]MDX9962812.1 M48 family metallopeptidase [Desulfobacter postgatei]